jgi:hypothetical protein
VSVNVIDQAGLTVYVDPVTIRRKGNLVTMWELYNYKTARTVGGDSFLSFKAQSEYDCAEERDRGLALTFFSDNMGRGKPFLTNSDEDKWKPVQPGSVGQSLWKVACNKE